MDFSLYPVKIHPPQHLVKFSILPGQFAAPPVQLLHTEHISFVYVWKTQNSDLTERGNLVENLWTSLRFHRKPDEDIHPTGTVKERCSNDHERNRCLHCNPIKNVISSRTLQMPAQQETLTQCLLFTLTPIFLHKLSPHTTLQPIISYHTFTNGYYLLTNQSPHQGFWIFNWLKVSLDSEDGFHTGCRKVSHYQQSFSGLQSPRWSDNQGYLLFYESGGVQAPLLLQLPPHMHQRT